MERALGLSGLKDVVAWFKCYFYIYNKEINILKLSNYC